jgi:hypothetical protein
MHVGRLTQRHEHGLIETELSPIYILFMQTPQRSERTEHATPHRYRDKSDTHERVLL